jgi:hypothetical protein
MRVHGIPVHPVRFGPQPRHGRHRGAGDNPTETQTPEAAKDSVDVTNISEEARIVPNAVARKKGLILDA